MGGRETAKAERGTSRKEEKSPGDTEEKETRDVIKENNVVYNEDTLLREGENTADGRKRLRAAVEQLTLWEESDYDVSAPSGTVDRTGGIKTIALGITRAGARTGGIELRGKKANTPQRLATLAQVFRNLSFETFRIFYMRENMIVASKVTFCQLTYRGAIQRGN